MKKLVIATFAAVMMTTGAMAGEQLTTSQLEQVTAAGLQFNINRTRQVAVALAGGIAVANNSNATWQSNKD